jgi:hypothetical protein
MPGQLLDLVQTEPPDDPVAQAGASKIVERAGCDAGPLPDLVEVMAEL